MFKLSCLGLLVLLFSCEKRTFEPDPTANQHLLRPKPGDVTVYYYDSLNYNDFTGVIDTFSLLVKEEVESVLDSTPTVYSLRSFWSAYDTASKSWYPMKTTQTDIYKTRIEVIDGSNRFVKLFFPALTDVEWAGNGHTNLDPFSYDWAYRYEKVWYTDTLVNQFADSSVRVLQRDEQDFTKNQYSMEVYTQHIGLTRREQFFTEQQEVGGRIVVKGYKLSMTAKSWKR